MGNWASLAEVAPFIWSFLLGVPFILGLQVLGLAEMQPRGLEGTASAARGSCNFFPRQAECPR
jgi:hypothetical protein